VEFKNKRVCVDFDGVLAYYTGWKREDHLGEPNVEGVKLVSKLYDMGCSIVIHTCRNNRDMNEKYGTDTLAMENRIIQWLVDNDLGFCTLSTEHGKPWAHVYVDDRAVRFRPNIGPADIVLEKVVNMLMEYPDPETEKMEREANGR